MLSRLRLAQQQAIVRHRGMSPARWLCASPGRHQTPIVDQLWRKRAEMRDRQQSVPDNSPNERKLISKSPSMSANSITYAFESDAELRDQYRNPWGNVRVGRLLEDLDALAGTVAFEHCQAPGEQPLLLVTASVDRIVYRHRPNLKDDIVVTGQPNWVGRSSMEIGIVARSTWAEEAFLEASFTFVARDPETNRPASINPLKCETDEEAARFKLGQARDEARKALRKRAKESALGHALDEETTASAHELLVRSKRLLSMPALADPGEILLSETRLQNALIAQPQQRNTAGRVFGGFLMRRAFELAHTTAYLFAGRRPIFLELDEVKFASPVSVGDLVKLESCVLFTSEAMDIKARHTVHVEVLAQVIQPERRSAVTSNVFNFTFGVAENADGTGRASKKGDPDEPVLRRVLPATHEESYRIMERYKADLAQRAEDEAALLAERCEAD